MSFEVALSKGVSLLFQAYASEVASEEYHALCLSVVSTSRGIGLIIGPAIGGYLAQLKETLHTRCRIARGRLNPNEPEYSPNELTDDGSTGRGLDDQNTQSKPSLLRKLSIDGYHHCVLCFFPPGDSLFRVRVTLQRTGVV
ncbi:hypothetical protein Bca101_091863 [Brassica carinata]